jgi:hypothetical protein
MAKKIFKGAGKVLGIGKKKAEPEAPTPVSGPVVTQLKAGDPLLGKPRRKNSLIGSLLGGTDRLGG